MLEFSCLPAVGSIGLDAEWQIETSPGSGTFVPLADGPIPGAEPAVAAILPPSPRHYENPATLVVSDATTALDARRIRVVLTNACGSSTSDPALLVVAERCLADFNQDGQADFFDYLDFAAAFDAEHPSADFNGDNQIDFFDYLDFVQAFDAGCE